MRLSRWAAAIVALAVLFVGGFFAGAAFFKEGPVLDAVRSPGVSDGEKAH